MAQFDRQGIGLLDALRAVVLDEEPSHATYPALRLLAPRRDRGLVDALLTRLRRSADLGAALNCTNGISMLDFPRATVDGLADVLAHDEQPFRRQAAAYGLGHHFFPHRQKRRAAERALIACLANRNEQADIRAQAAECLAYVNRRSSREPLLIAAEDPHPTVRFWAVFALGSAGCLRGDPQARAAVEGALGDDALPATPGYWPIRLEALALLNRHAAEAERIKASGEAASDFERRWLTCWGDWFDY